MDNLSESFSIPIYEWKTLDVGQKTIRIRGVALKGDVVSRNNRKYTREALLKATNTWIGKPINVNHNDSLKVGTIKWMDYDTGSDSLMYEAEITREPYISLLRNKSAEIRGLSIQADYIYNRCAKCGKKFYTEEEWYDHMTNEHFLKDLPTEPHGIQGSAISLVLSPEIPGYTGTTYELEEMAKRATLRLLETVIKTKLEEEKHIMKRIVRAGASHVSVGRTGIKTNAIEEQEQECPEGEHWDPEKEACVKDTPVSEQEHECAEGEHWDEEKQACVANTAEEQEEHSCPEGEHWSETEGKCEKNQTSQATPDTNASAASETEGEDLNAEPDVGFPDEKGECPLGQHWDEKMQACMPDVDTDSYVQEASTQVLRQSKLQPLRETVRVKLKLGEPFAGYTDFADCVAKNQEKDNPEAYCGQIKHEAEGNQAQSSEIKALRAKVNELVEEVNKPLQVTVPKIKMPKDAFGWKRKKPYSDKHLREAIRKIKPYNDKSLREAINRIKPYDDAEVKRKLGEIQAKIPQLEQTIQKQAQDNAKIKEAYEADLAAYKKDLEEYWKPLEQKVKDMEEKKLKESTDTTQRLETLETQLENALDKQTGKVKGVAQLNEEAGYKVTVTDKKDNKKNPDLSFKPGGD